MGSESLYSEKDSDEMWVPPAKENASCSKGLKRQLKTTKEPSKRVNVEDTSKNSKSTKKQRESVENTGGSEEKSSETESGEKSKPRRKIPCPMFACRANVIHLPRHMRTVHHWTKEAASKVLAKYNIRKRKNVRTAKKKNYHSRRRCPLANCHAIVQRLPAHLKEVHKLDKSSKEYCDALKNGAVAPDVRHDTIHWQEERFTTKRREGGPETQSIIPDILNNDLSSGDDTGSETDSNFDDNDSAVEDISSTASMPALLQEFEDWFRSPDGGKRDEKTVKQHSAQLFSMLKIIDKEEEDAKSLLDVKLVRQVFLKSHVQEKKYEAGTIKSYLMSLRHFYTFLISDRPKNFDFDVEQVNANREKVKLWSGSFKRESSERKWQKLEEDMINRLTPANIRDFEKSPTAREAVKIIGEHSDASRTTVVTQQSYTLVRDFLFAEIFIENANRPGVLASMTIEEYRKMVKQDDRYIITVLRHKTSHVHGPARIVLNAQLKSWLTIFVEIMRPQIASATTGNVFLSWNGKQMISGHITKAVQSVFKKSGMDVKVTSTSFRKAAVTAVHSGNPALSGKLARHMAHSETTAKKYYLLTEKTKESVETSKELGALMRCNNEKHPDADGNSKGESIEKDDEDGENDSNGKGSTNRKILWTDGDLDQVKFTFRKDIAAKKISMDRVRQGIDSNKELDSMSPRRIYDKIRKIISQDSSSSKAVLELPEARESLEDKLQRFDEHDRSESYVDEEMSTSLVPPSERNSCFTSEEVSSIHNLFKDMITENRKICRVEIEKRLSSSKDGQKILNKLSVSKVLNRIKYERLKKRREQK